jgi:hypothetical protein
MKDNTLTNAAQSVLKQVIEDAEKVGSGLLLVFPDGNFERIDLMDFYKPAPTEETT